MSISDPRASARAGLAAYLTTQLAGVTVSENWPVPGVKLVTPSVTIITSPRINAQYHAPRLWKTTPTVGVNGLALYSYGRAEINLQLDAWESYEGRRDALAARIETEINRDPLETLDPNPARVVGYKRRPGLMLKLANYYNTPCEFIFETPAAQIAETRDQTQIADWRCTFSGRAILHLMDQETVALMKTIVMTLDVSEGFPPDNVPLAP